MHQKEQESPDRLVIGTLRGLSYAKLKEEGIRVGLTLKISHNLDQELLKGYSRKGRVAYYAGLFLPDSGNRALADQGEMVLMMEDPELRGSLG